MQAISQIREALSGVLSLVLYSKIQCDVLIGALLGVIFLMGVLVEYTMVYFQV
jgi:hypothetical protein